MQFGTVIDGATAEVVFRTARLGITKTTTSTSTTLPLRGSPMILATATQSANGVYITQPATSSSILNNLYIGNVAQYPGTNSAIGWQGEDLGLIQCHGYSAIARLGTASVAAGTLLVPNSDYTLAAAGAGPVTSSTASAGTPGIGGLAVCLTDVATTTGVAGGKVFLRAL